MNLQVIMTKIWLTKSTAGRDGVVQYHFSVFLHSDSDSDSDLDRTKHETPHVCILQRRRRSGGAVKSQSQKGESEK